MTTELKGIGWQSMDWSYLAPGRELWWAFVKTAMNFQVLLHTLLHTLFAGLLARSQYPEGPATGHLGTGFSWFPCVYKRMLRWFPRLQVATACFSCSPPDINFLDPHFIFMYMLYNHCHRATAHLQLNIVLLLLFIYLCIIYLFTYLFMYYLFIYLFYSDE